METQKSSCPKQSAKVWNDLLKHLFSLAGFVPIPFRPGIIKEGLCWPNRTLRRTVSKAADEGPNPEVSKAADEGLCYSVVDYLLCALTFSSVSQFEMAFETQVKLERKGQPTVYLGIGLHWRPKGVVLE